MKIQTNASYIFETLKKELKENIQYHINYVVGAIEIDINKCICEIMERNFPNVIYEIIPDGIQTLLECATNEKFNSKTGG